jgi:rSAM/selenodomain-associated transferase 1
LKLLPQSPGDLGSRLEAAFEAAFQQADRVVVVGTDAPGVDAEVVDEAFRSLKTVDLVLGPASDGGYYLLGLRDPAPELFREIPWSTGEVLEETLSRAKTAGLRWALLPVLRDLDTSKDWEEMREGLGTLFLP